MVKFAFLDWDDTLFPTTALKLDSDNAEPRNAFRKASVQKSMEKHEKAVIDFIEKLRKVGYKVFIVTNATASWVQDTARMMPDVLRLPIELVSAADLCGPTYRDDVYKWKVCAFQSILETHEEEEKVIPSHVLSVGDQPFEQAALRCVEHERTQVVVNNVRVLVSKSVHMLSEQLEHLSTKLHGLSKSKESSEQEFRANNKGDFVLVKSKLDWYSQKRKSQSPQSPKHCDNVRGKKLKKKK